MFFNYDGGCQMATQKRYRSTNNMVFVGLINFGLPCIVGKKTGIAVDTTIIIPMSQIMQIHFDEKLTLSKL